MRRAILPLCLVFGIAACGGGSSKGGSDSGTPDAPVVTTDSGTPDVAVDGIDTLVSATVVEAGKSITVRCVGSGFNPWKVKILVWMAVESAAGGGDDATGAGVPDAAEAESLPDPATVTIPEGVTIVGETVEFTRAGDYAVACWAEAEGMFDETPADVRVNPGPPAAVDTAADPHEVTAGDSVTVTCSPVDEYGNAVEAPCLPVATPAEGAVVSGLSIQLTRAGTVSVACTVTDTAIADPTPDKVKVVHNIPKKIVTQVDPSTFPAGDSGKVKCFAADYYDNPVEDFQMAIALSPGLDFDGKSVTSKVAGVYEAKCTPETEELQYFTLEPAQVTVVPGDPVVLELKKVPDKAYYGVGEALQVIATARDEFGNQVPKATVGSPAIDPPTGIEPSPQNPTGTFLLKAEGKYTMRFALQAFPAVFANLQVIVEGSGPLLTIVYPERGATIDGKPSVNLIGQVNDTVTGIQSLTINGDPVDPGIILVDGSFSYLLKGIRQGLNFVHAEVVNGAGMRTWTTRAFYFSYWFYPADAADPAAGLVDDSVQAFLGRDFFDDGNHDPAHPDDLATILEQFLSKLNLNALIPSPVASSGDYKIYLKNVSFGKPAIKLATVDGGLAMNIVLPNLHMNVDLIGKCTFLGIDFCPDFHGSVDVSKVTANADVAIWTDNGKIKAQMKKIDVNLSNIDVDVSGILGWLFDWLIDLLVDSFTGTIEKAIEGQIGSMVNKTLEDLFAKFTINQTIDVPALLPGSAPTSITLMTKPSLIDFETAGCSLDMDATVYSTKGVSHDVLGSISRSDCLVLDPPQFVLPQQYEITFAAYDDVLNQALFGVWWSGALNLKIGQDTLGEVDLSQYGITELDVKLDFYLPPILTDCTATGDIQVQVGDLYIDANMLMFGNPLHIGAFVTAAASADISMVAGASGGNEIGLTLLALDRFEMEIVDITEGMEEAKDGLVQLIKDQLGNATKDLFGKPLASFPIPVIDLSTLMPDLPPGSLALQFALETLYREAGNTVVGGHLE